MPGNCRFNLHWTKEVKYKEWLAETAANHSKARCKVCNVDFSIAWGGKSALDTHVKGIKHIANMASKQKNKIDGYVGRDATQKPTATLVVSDLDIVQDSSAQPAAASERKQTNIMDTQMISKNDVLKAEVLWTLNVIANHLSYRSSDQSDKLFTHMFPDSSIAKQFSCGQQKCKYLTVFGLAEHFKNELLTKIRDSGPICLMFDESLNKKSQQKQMDIHVRYWDNVNYIQTRYIDSVFLGHASHFFIIQII